MQRASSPWPVERSPRGKGRKGLFIVFEGIEGSGKSTQVKLVAEAIRAAGTDPVVTREPGGTSAGEAIRAVALDRGLDLNRVAELLLMLAARSVFVEEVVRPALAADRVVLADRYELSTFAYQGGGRELPLDQIRALNTLATGGLRPDLCIVIDVSVEQGLARRSPGTRDRIEGEDPQFHRRVARAYRELAAAGDPNIALVDGRGDIRKVFAAVWEILSSRFPETFAPRQGY